MLLQGENADTSEVAQRLLKSSDALAGGFGGAGWGSGIGSSLHLESTSSPIKFLERLSLAPDSSGLFLTWQNNTER